MPTATEPTIERTADEKRGIRDAMFINGSKCARYPWCRWHLAIHFRDTDGAYIATWQLLLPDDRGADYSLTLRDGIPERELSKRDLIESSRIALRDEATYLERMRIGAPIGMEAV